MKIRLIGTEKELDCALKQLEKVFNIVSKSKLYDSRYSNTEKRLYIEAAPRLVGKTIASQVGKTGKFKIVYTDGIYSLPLKNNLTGQQLRFRSKEEARIFIEKNIPNLTDWEICEVKVCDLESSEYEYINLQNYDVEKQIEETGIMRQKEMIDNGI